MDALISARVAHKKKKTTLNFKPANNLLKPYSNRFRGALEGSISLAVS